MPPLNCIVVDDSLIFRKVVRDCLKQLPDINIVDVAADGLKAVDKICEHKPDLVTLDVEMPGQDGIDVLREIRSRSIDCDVIMVSSQTHRAAEATTRALALGAFDYILKPNSGSPDQNLQELLTELSPKVEAIRRRRRRGSVSTATPATSASISPAYSNSVHRLRHSGGQPAAAQYHRAADNNSRPIDCTSGPADAIAIGVSTGGPAALREILPMLPANLAVPIFLVQHMPPLFTASLARDLNEVSKITVCEAAHRQPIRSGHVYIAPGGAHMRVAGLAGNRYIEITDDPPVRACRPSVDYLFESMAKVYGASVFALVLTGMGNDGTAGSRAIKQRGGRVVAQDESTSTVFGMPRQVIDAGLADRIEPLQNIAAIITRVASQGALVCH